jgi:ferric-dicitrate binding protein FerR (iron transport regulator)
MTALSHRGRVACLGLTLGIGLSAGPAGAQTRGCTITTYTDPPRETLTCPDGLTISTEAGAGYRLSDRNGDGLVDTVQLTAKGVLVDVPPRRRGGFQVQTPHAIAAVRGTVWAVEVTPERSSIFVRTGSVSVNRPGGPAVILRDGDGVDVEAGSEPLRVNRWGAARAALFLARFGR